MDQRKLCGCGYARATQMIGSLQIVGSVMVTMNALLQLYDLHAKESHEEFYAAAVGDGILFFNNKFSKNQLLAAKWDTWIILIFSNASLIMGIALLVGSYTRNTAHIYAWIVYTNVTAFICGVLTFIFCMFANSWAEAFVKMFCFVIFLVIIFCLLRVVRIHKQEIEDTTLPVFC